MMGGDVTVTSEFDKGSVFRLEIPVMEGTAPISSGKIAPRRVLGIEDSQPPCRVLIVEDMKDNRTLLAKLLSSAGFKLHEAVNGADAVTAFSIQQPHLIIMDQRMPEMNGDEVIRQIRSSPGGDAVKIIAITADATTESRELIMTAGADDFMTKPFGMGELLEKIRLLTGVRYIYAEAVEPSVPFESVRPDSATTGLPPALTLEMIESITDQLSKQIYDAAIGCREGKLLTLLEQITLINPELSQRLRNIIEVLDYETLIELFDRGKRFAIITK
jgi:CheY-like chemotaxis protein